MVDPPQLVPVGFKEWFTVTAAIGAGRQSIMLRKGGIAEGKTGFSFKYPNFFLFPTGFHEQEESVREAFEEPEPAATGDRIPIKLFVEVLWKGELNDWEKIRRLEPLHILKEEVVRQRFVYSGGAGEGSLQLAVLRVWRLGVTWRIPEDRRYGGCRSWVNLPVIPDAVSSLELRPVIDQGHRTKLVGVLESLGINAGV